VVHCCLRELQKQAANQGTYVKRKAEVDSHFISFLFSYDELTGTLLDLVVFGFVSDQTKVKSQMADGLFTSSSVATNYHTVPGGTSAPPYLVLGKGHFTSLYLKLLFCLLETFFREPCVLFYPKYIVIS
jgi:hypothetical protein